MGCADYDWSRVISCCGTLNNWALTTHWGWQSYAKTCRGRIWNVLIKIHYFVERLLVFLHTILQDALFNHQEVISYLHHKYNRRTSMTSAGFEPAIPVIGSSSVPRIFFRGGSTNSAEDRGQREWGSGGSSPLVRGFTQFVNERNLYSD
jgi:hypothetical protein